MRTDNMIKIETEDTDFFNALMSFEHPSIKISKLDQKSFDPVPILRAVVEICKQVDINLFSVFLYDYVVKHSPKNTFVSGHNITINPTQIFVIIEQTMNPNETNSVTDEKNDL